MKKTLIVSLFTVLLLSACAGAAPADAADPAARHGEVLVYSAPT